MIVIAPVNVANPAAFSRAGSARYHAGGLVASATTDVLRYQDSNRTNLCGYSEYTATKWLPVFGVGTLTGGHTAYDNSLTAARYVRNGGAGSELFRISSFTNFTAFKNRYYTLSFWCKLNSMVGTFIAADIQDGSNGLPTGNYYSQLAVGEWRRVSLTGLCTADTTVATIDIINNTSSNIDAYFWGVQVEEGLSATAYIPSLGGTSTSRLAARYALIEPAATNLCLYSEDFRNTAEVGSARPWGQFDDTSNFVQVTQVSQTNPAGGATSSKIAVGIAGTPQGCQVAQGFVDGLIPDNSAMTISVYAKAQECFNFNLALSTKDSKYPSVRYNLQTGVLTVEDWPGYISGGGLISGTLDYLGNGWFRASATFTSARSGPGAIAANIVLLTSTGTPYSGTSIGDGMLLWGAQVELGLKASSYIPTTTVAVARAADVLSTGILSSIPEPDTGETAWNAATNYSVGASVYRTPPGWIYTNTLAGVDSIVPEVSALTANPTRWFKTQPTNRYAMFTYDVSTKSTATNTIRVVINPDTRVSAIALLGMENVDQINISASYNGGTSVIIEDKINYYYDSTGTKQQFASYIATDISPFYGLAITVELTGVGIIKCKNLVVGKSQFIGNTQRGIRNDALNFSTIERDLYGNASMVQRRNVPKVSLSLVADKELVNPISKLRDTLNATPAVWSGLDEDTSDDYYESLLILGFYKTFSINIDNPIIITVSLDLEEV